MTPERALAVARQCAGEGRSTPAPVVAVLLAELARLGEVERAARAVDLDDWPNLSIHELRRALRS